MSEQVYVFGAGGLASEFTLMLEDLLDETGEPGYEVIAYVETEPHGTSFMGRPIISEQRLREVAAESPSTGLFIAIGSAEVRARIVGWFSHYVPDVRSSVSEGECDGRDRCGRDHLPKRVAHCECARRQSLLREFR